MFMNYKKRRLKSGLSVFTIAKELGISEEIYKKVEQGRLNLEKGMLDKFLKITENSKEILFNRQAKMQEINDWLKNGQAEQDIKKLGYTKTELSKMLGYDGTYIDNVIRNFEKDKNFDKKAYDIKEKIFDYVKNPLNKNIKSTETQKVKLSKIDEWVESGQAKIDVKNSGKSQLQWSLEMGYEKSYVGNLLRTGFVGKYLPQKQKLYDLLHAEENNEPTTEEIKSIEKINIDTVTREEPSCDIKPDYETELKILKEKYENLNKSCEQLAKDNVELLKDNQYLKESLKRLFKF